MVSDWLKPTEMMFGSREEFEYFQCADCDCLQILEAPDNMGKYYPENYYSFGVNRQGEAPSKKWMGEDYVYARITRNALGWGSLAGKVFNKFFPPKHLPSWLSALPKPVDSTDSILDVGSGSGTHLTALRSIGFRNLLGIDPYIDESVTLPGGFMLKKCSITDLAEKYHFIMFHHVFEHLEFPLETLRVAKNLLYEGGQIMIRIPLADSLAAKTYREKWVQLDAPRHITLQSRKSMEHLARLADCKITNIVYDSCEFQFWGSELYRQDIALMESNEVTMPDSTSHFTREEMVKYSNRARELNRAGNGDQAIFILQANSK